MNDRPKPRHECRCFIVDYEDMTNEEINRYREFRCRTCGKAEAQAAADKIKNDYRAMILEKRKAINTLVSKRKFWNQQKIDKRILALGKEIESLERDETSVAERAWYHYNDVWKGKR